ncbi:hypothetical protein [Sphingomonas sp.]|uniref:hypothetical protein n=1 Tax=Sphingomonas sp. TaxID=28214 RepID=UPI002FD8A187
MKLPSLVDFRSPRVLPAVILLIGFVERVIFLALQGVQHALGEAENVALSVARDGSIADVFARGSGLTAHVNPVLPSLAGSVYRVFGVQSALSEWILALLSISTVLAAGAVFCRAAGVAGIPRPARLGALAIFALLPISPDLETISFRVWEGGLASLLGATVLLLALRADKAAALRYSHILVLSLTAAFLFFINPALGLAAYGVVGLLLLRRAHPRTWIGHGAIVVAVLAAVLTPWTIRNYEVFGRIMPLRGNFGLELAVGNHPAAMHPGQREAFVERLQTIHPLENQAAFDRMQAMGGEIPYAQAMGEEAKAWIHAHPGDFAQLCVRHAAQYYFPPRWQWNIYTGQISKSVLVRQPLLWTISALGLIGAFAALFAWRTRMLYLATLAVVPVLPYIITQPVPRYRYIVLLPLLFLGADFAYRLLRRLRPDRSALS